LIVMLNDEALEWCAARSLGRLRDARAAPALREHVRLTTGHVNRMAVWALGELGDTGAIARLDTLRRQVRAEFAVDSAAIDSAMAKLNSGSVGLASWRCLTR
jgi:HEAT repeat protein